MHNFAPPLGLLYLKSFIEENNAVKVDFFNFQTPEKPSLGDFIKYLKLVSPDVVGITVLTPFWYGTCQVTASIKKQIPDAIIIGGGPHMWEYPEESLEAGNFDIIIQGRGERPLQQLLECLAAHKPLANIPGTVYRKDGRIIKNRPTPLKEGELDRLPSPDRTVLDIKQHKFSVNNHNPAALMIASRGCPYNCSFCVNKEQYFKSRSPKNVVKEIQECLRLGYKSVQFCDDVFSYSRSHSAALCNEMLEQKIHIPWACQTRVDCVDLDLLQLMAKAGCERIQFGIESMNQRYLNRINKNITLQQTAAAFHFCKQAGLQTVANIIIGFPGETAEEARATLDFTASLEPDFIFCNPLIPIPGTRIFEEASQDPAFDSDWFKRFIRRPLPNEKVKLWITAMGEEQISRMIKGFYLRYYFSPRRILRHLLNISGPRDLMEKIKTAAALAFSKNLFPRKT